MTALIGGLCVGVLWGVWATRQLLIKRKEIREIMARNKARNAKLEVIFNGKENGKEQTKKGQTGKTGEAPNH